MNTQTLLHFSSIDKIIESFSVKITCTINKTYMKTKTRPEPKNRFGLKLDYSKRAVKNVQKKTTNLSQAKSFEFVYFWKIPFVLPNLLLAIISLEWAADFVFSKRNGWPIDELIKMRKHLNFPKPWCGEHKKIIEEEK